MRQFLGASALISALLLGPVHVLANAHPGTARCGHVDELSLVSTDFMVHLTGIDSKEVFPPGWPKTLKGQHVYGKYGAPDTWQAHTITPCLPNVYDAQNTTTPKVAAGGPGNKGGGNAITVTADLRIESVKVSAGPTYSNGNIFQTIDTVVGRDVEVLIPDLYLSDSSGQMIDGATLYSLVDLDTYLVNPPVFSLGDVFQIIGGSVTTLPGMEFSSTPFTFDPATGHSGTPVDGYGYTLTEHGFETVPEPSAWALMLAGVALVAAMTRAARTRHALRGAEGALAGP